MALSSPATSSSNSDPEPPTPHLATPTLHPPRTPTLPAVRRLTHPPGNMQGFLAAWAQRGTLSFNRWKGKKEKKIQRTAPRLHRPKCQGGREGVGTRVGGECGGRGDRRKSHNTCSICRHGWLHILPRPAPTTPGEQQFYVCQLRVYYTGGPQKRKEEEEEWKKTKQKQDTGSPT